jgi:DNA polymerase III subunit delta'
VIPGPKVPAAVPAVLEGVPPRAAAALAAAVPAPVHAYLLVGPAGSGTREAARAFGAALLCPDGGCGHCRTCRRVKDANHPDLVMVERAGASILMDQAREIVRLAARSPLEGNRKVLVLTDFHLVDRAGPALLKTLEEPSASTVLVLTAERITPELVTIASRCVKIDFPAVDRGADRAGGGGLGAAGDPEQAARLTVWRELPDRLDGTGATAMALAAQLIESLDAAVEPVRARQAEEEAAVAQRAKITGERASAAETEARLKREQRRARMDELRGGLVELALAYRDRLVTAASAREAAAVETAAAAVTGAGQELVRNPNEALLLQALLLRIGS